MTFLLYARKRAKYAIGMKYAAVDLITKLDAYYIHYGCVYFASLATFLFTDGLHQSYIDRVVFGDRKNWS